MTFRTLNFATHSEISGNFLLVGTFRKSESMTKLRLLLVLSISLIAAAEASIQQECDAIYNQKDKCAFVHENCGDHGNVSSVCDRLL
jgi:hypothetical protein